MFEKHLMIHQVEASFFKPDLSDYYLTYDDGLYVQYYYYPLFKKYQTSMFFFICTHYIREKGLRKTFDGHHYKVDKYTSYIIDAHFKNDFSQFMTIDEVQFLAEQEDVVIGSHSHFHDIVLTDHPLKKKLSKWKANYLPGPDTEENSPVMNRRSRLAFKGYEYRDRKLFRRSETAWLDYVKYDTEQTLAWFDTHLSMVPQTYCFPFNEYNDTLIKTLRSFGFKTFYNGKTGDNVEIINRTSIEKLVDALD
jgi:hypothetical protein